MIPSLESASFSCSSVVLYVAERPSLSHSFSCASRLVRTLNRSNAEPMMVPSWFM